MELEQGAPVFSGSGDSIGKVKRITEDRFLVERDWQRDMWFEEAAIARIEDRRVILKPQTYELDDWTVHPVGRAT